jgi:hypothetical protein
LPGGFGSATSEYHSSLKPKSLHTHGTPAVSRKRSNPEITPATVAVKVPPPDTQTLFDEWVKLTASKKILEKLFDDEESKPDALEIEGDEKSMRQQMMRGLTKRRQDIANLFGQE